MIINSVNKLSTTVTFDNVQVIALRSLLSYVLDFQDGSAEEYAAEVLNRQGHTDINDNDVLAMMGQITASLDRVMYPEYQTRKPEAVPLEDMEPVGKTQ